MSAWDCDCWYDTDDDVIIDAVLCRLVLDCDSWCDIDDDETGYDDDDDYAGSEDDKWWCKMYIYILSNMTMMMMETSMIKFFFIYNDYHI